MPASESSAAPRRRALYEAEPCVVALWSMSYTCANRGQVWASGIMARDEDVEQFGCLDFTRCICACIPASGLCDEVQLPSQLQSWHSKFWPVEVLLSQGVEHSGQSERRVSEVICRCHAIPAGGSEKISGVVCMPAELICRLVQFKGSQPPPADE